MGSAVPHSSGGPSFHSYYRRNLQATRLRIGTNDHSYVEFACAYEWIIGLRHCVDVRICRCCRSNSNTVERNFDHLFLICRLPHQLQWAECAASRWAVLGKLHMRCYCTLVMAWVISCCRNSMFGCVGVPIDIYTKEAFDHFFLL